MKFFQFVYILKRPILMIGLALIILSSFFTVYHLNDLARYAEGSYASKFENYSKIEALKSFTPQNGSIILPIQSSLWPDISNPVIVRYFLFPRVLVSSSYLDQFSLGAIKEAYFIKLQKGGNLWPQLNITKKIILFGKHTFKYRELREIPNSDGVYKIDF